MAHVQFGHQQNRVEHHHQSGRRPEGHRNGFGGSIFDNRVPNFGPQSNNRGGFDRERFEKETYGPHHHRHHGNYGNFERKESFGEKLLNFAGKVLPFGLGVALAGPTKTLAGGLIKGAVKLLGGLFGKK